ncbi:MAG: ABC transporter ATP-binding protein [Firmicutes bacterium]|nr:ABC transporter ATP-binding protein [Bacillota bacterium]
MAGAAQALSGQALLEIEGLAIRFGGLVAVSNFNLGLNPGELVGLIGPNGAGKTTVFNMITGIYRPTAGRIRFEGREMIGLRPDQVVSRGIAWTFQNIRLLGSLKVIDNVMIAHHFRLRSGPLGAILRVPAYIREEQQMYRNSLELLEAVGLAHLAEETAGSLPYGEQRRLEIARALATRPKLLLLDEPAAGMNPQETLNLMSFIQKMRRDFGLTIFLIEHDMQLVMGICERIVVLDYGNTIAEGTPAEIRKNPRVIQAYLGVEAGQEGA